MYTQKSRMYTQKSRIFTQKNPIYTRKSAVCRTCCPMYPQKNPIYTQKNPIYTQKSPISIQKSPRILKGTLSVPKRVLYAVYVALYIPRRTLSIPRTAVSILKRAVCILKTALEYSKDPYLYPKERCMTYKLPCIPPHTPRRTLSILKRAKKAVCIHPKEPNYTSKRAEWGGSISRLLKMIGLFCRIQSLLQGSFAKETFAKETYNLKEPTNRSHAIPILSRARLSKAAHIHSLECWYGSFRCVHKAWLRLVGSLKSQVSFAEYRLFYGALFQKRPVI